MRSTCLYFALALLAGAPLLGSETLELANGTKLVGTVTKKEDGKIYFHADLVGDVVLDTSSVVSETPSAPPPVASAPAPGAPTAPPPAAPAVAGGTAPQIVPAPAPSTAAAAAVTASAPAAAEAAAAQAPGQVFWKRIVSVSGSYTSAAYTQGAIKGAPAGFPTGAQTGLQGTQSTLNVSATVVGATPYQSVTLTGSYGYANYQPSGTVVNNHSLEGTYTYMLSPKDYWLTRATYKVDLPAGIEHAFEDVVGFGHKFIDTDKAKLDLIPGISAVNDNRGTPYDNRWILSAGFLEHLDYNFSDKVSLEEHFKYRIGVSHTEDWAIDSYVGIKAQITKELSFNTGLTWTYDNTLGPVPPTVLAGLIAQGVPVSIVDELRPANKAQAQVTSGLEFDW